MWTRRQLPSVLFFTLRTKSGWWHVVSDSITDYGRRPAAPLAIERLQATGLSSKINPACWSTAAEENCCTNSLDLFKSRKIKFVFKEEKKLLSKLWFWGVSIEWKGCFPLLACCWDPYQTASRLDELWTLLISSWLKVLWPGSFFVLFCFVLGRRKDSDRFVSRQEWKKLYNPFFFSRTE